MSYARMSRVTHSYDSWHTKQWVMSHIGLGTSHVIHMNFTCVLPSALTAHALVGSLQRQCYRVAKTHRMPQIAGQFQQKATSCRVLLRGTIYKDKASYGSSPPCIGLLLDSTRFQGRAAGAVLSACALTARCLTCSNIAPHVNIYIYTYNICTYIYMYIYIYIHTYIYI